MRIISDFHDYYDVGMQNGIDPQLPYRRFRREEPITFPDLGYKSLGRMIAFYGRFFNIFFIGFAGKIWPCIDISNNGTPSDYIFDPNLIDEDMCLKFNKERWYWGRQPRREKDRRFIAAGIKKEIAECFVCKDRSELLDLFEKFKTAIFVYKLGEERVAVNDSLSSFRFQKILPPIQAFQELEMYVGSYLTKPVIEEPPISDQVKAEIHGFDRFSFRKDKS